MTNSGTVLVVCTGNVCRSPYLERRLRQELVGTGITVSGAGTRALTGRGMDPGTRERLLAVGADVDGFAARDLTPQLMREADLVVTAAREHRAAATRLFPGALRRTITLRDLADLLDGVAPADLLQPPPADGASWVRHVADRALLRRGTVPARQDGVDVHDPIGEGAEGFALMARQIDDALGPVVAALRAGGTAPRTP
ncbi:low molecular weight phosphatase family protein [Arthrobacter sp. NEB 688]|uniref:arsenate-mycothiol transferase ArsC n=1 Tax=Arthrobacter sp. NEB 688 TaxID=904039 RepID=UPI001564CE59|nr:low molecular weight phosphatase family protein [Arthrobacter sp. NEB 688]QKE85627.1 low molecular weight phosphatase family protein [Arthrobacter sp. NEB 688]